MKNYRFTIKDGDDDLRAWSENQSSMPQSLRLVVKHFIAYYGNGDVAEALVHKMKKLEHEPVEMMEEASTYSEDISKTDNETVNEPSVVNGVGIESQENDTPVITNEVKEGQKASANEGLTDLLTSLGL